MPLVAFGAEHEALLACPSCRGPIQLEQTRFRCVNGDCRCSLEPFPLVANQPVLIDFDDSIFDRQGFADREGTSAIPRDVKRARFLVRLRRKLMGSNQTAATYATIFANSVKAISAKPRILIIGGGTIGNGMSRLYDEPDIEIVSLDVFVSPYTTLVADGHKIPFKDGTFHGVWIQAVLEHVLTPMEVAAEVHRVLHPGGFVFADTPFMQQVHEKAFDFTRFTVSGQRWLFRHFDHIASGASGGAGTATAWSLQYLVRSVTRSQRAGTAMLFAMSWLRVFDRFRSRFNNDAASGVFFFGSRSERKLNPKEMVAFYEEQAKGVEPT